MSDAELSKLESKLEKVVEDISGIKTHLAVNTTSLQEHMRRTEMLERRLDSVWSRALTGLSIISALIVLAKQVWG